VRRALLALLAVLARPGAAGADEMVRIGVATGLDRVQLSGPDLAASPLRDGAGRLPTAGDRAEVRLEGESLLLDGAPVEGAGVGFTSPGGIRYGGRVLSGEVEVRRGPGGLEIIDALPLEDYVAQVTGAEMPPAFPPQALRAQAVAARTYALARKLEALGEGRDFDLGSTVLAQVYPGQGGGDARARAAAEATRGEVLVHDRQPIEAYFHSACGGRTESGAAALGRDEPYLKSVACGRCGEAPKARWTLRIAAAELGRAAGLGQPASGARIVSRSGSGRAARVEIAAGGRKARMAAVELRQRLGWDRLPSLAFSIRETPEGFAFEGTGSGHGAGLCQWGAAGRARAGEDYRTILRAYYPGTELVKMY
jgi:stage II sporulation protein D